MKTLVISSDILNQQSFKDAVSRHNITIHLNAYDNHEVSDEDYDKLKVVVEELNINRAVIATNEMYDALNLYAINLCTSASVADIFGVAEEKVQDVFAETDFLNVYENAPFDEDGYTKEGNDIIDDLLDTVVDKILS